MDFIKKSKVIRSFVAQTQREDVVAVLRIRFGEEAGPAVVPLLEQIEDPEQLRDLLALATRCTTIEEFRTGLTAAQPTPSRQRRSRSRKG